MGLGRHRSARHGVPSRRKQASFSKGQWVTRTQAAQLAGVHYNTIRLWEGAGKVRSERRPGIRGKLLNLADLGRVVGEMQAERSGVGALNGAGKQIEARFDRLIANLEKMLEAARR